MTVEVGNINVNIDINVYAGKHDIKSTPEISPSPAHHSRELTENSITAASQIHHPEQSLQLQRRIISRQNSKATPFVIVPQTYDTTWKTLSQAVQGKEYMMRVLEYHKLMVRVNGMLAGFAFLAFEEEPKALERYYNWHEWYGITGILSFTFACLATVISLILFTMMTLLGPEGARFFGGMID